MAAKEQQRNGQVPAAVTAKLQSLISGHVVEANDFDSHSLRQELLCMTGLSSQGSRLTWCRTAILHASRSGHDSPALPLKKKPSGACRALAALPERSALAVLSNCTKVRLRGVRNRSAWLTSQCRRMSEAAAKQPAQT